MWVGCRRVARSAGLACLALSLLSSCGATGPLSDDGDADDPHSVAPLIDKAERMRAHGEYASAITAYEQALERTPWNERIQLALAMTYADRAARSRREGQLGAAEDDLRKSLELAPGHPAPTGNLAVVLMERANLEMDPERAAARRAEAETLSPGITSKTPVRNAPLERRLDMAYELVERGQLEAGIDRLESLHESFPEETEVTRLLGQSLIQLGAKQASAGNNVAAGRTLDRAVGMYREVPGCAAPTWEGCDRNEVRLAHNNRIVSWINAGERENARAALVDAQSMGLAFPDLARFLAK